MSEGRDEDHAMSGRLFTLHVGGKTWYNLTSDGVRKTVMQIGKWQNRLTNRQIKDLVARALHKGEPVASEDNYVVIEPHLHKEG